MVFSLAVVNVAHFFRSIHIVFRRKRNLIRGQSTSHQYVIHLLCAAVAVDAVVVVIVLATVSVVVVDFDVSFASITFNATATTTTTTTVFPLTSVSIHNSHDSNYIFINVDAIYLIFSSPSTQKLCDAICVNFSFLPIKMFLHTYICAV